MYFFLIFPKNPQLKNGKQKKKKKKIPRATEAVTNNYEDIFLDLGEQNEKQNHGVLNFFPAFIVYFYSLGSFFRRGCTKILIFLFSFYYFFKFLLFFSICEWLTGCASAKANITYGR